MIQTLVCLVWMMMALPLWSRAGDGPHGRSGDSALTRREIPLNDGWLFHYGYDFRAHPAETPVTLPHTWNAADVLTNSMDYEKTTGVYERQLFVPADWKGKRLFLYFYGANSVATVFVNYRWSGEHKGGYTAFCLEITDKVKYGANNQLRVQVSNAYREDVLPVSGDFDHYGGLHRPVSLLVTDMNCITPLDYAGPGIYVVQQKVTKERADLDVHTRLSVTPGRPLALHITLLGASSDVVAEKTVPVSGEDVHVAFGIASPHLWDGKADPYLYKARVELVDGGVAVDRVSQFFGLRYYRVDPDSGFFLNGKYLDLYGVGFHEDAARSGSAYNRADYERDMQLINELGATALRFPHYPHGQYMYDLCDRNGQIVWSEIPFVGPGGYTGPGYIKTKAFEDNARQMLTEMIRQYYNHPSVCFWGLFNEQKLDYDNPVPFIRELDTLAGQEDPTRLTTGAANVYTSAFNDCSDVLAWNKYLGWYGGRADDLGPWLDSLHRLYPGKPVAVSEYGAGASPRQHSETLVKPDPSGKFHPEEYQTYLHEQSWAALSARRYLWTKFVWNLADFPSSVRDEGDTPGLNDKGLVTYDRKTKKDAFYWYKANWNADPILYICERRNRMRRLQTTAIKVYTNQPGAELWVNGKSLGSRNPDELKRIIWPDVFLAPGENHIVVRSGGLSDSCAWIYAGGQAGVGTDRQAGVGTDRPAGAGTGGPGGPVSGQCPIVPLPNHSTAVAGAFVLTDRTPVIVTDRGFASAAAYLERGLLRYAGIAVVQEQGGGSSRQTGGIRRPGGDSPKVAGGSPRPDAQPAILLERRRQPSGNPEAYSIRMSSKGIVISAGTDTGAFYGVVSLLQLAAGDASRLLPCWDITDQPAYSWRGMLLDESRHFWGKAQVEKLLDRMAMYKLNRFHWHLTDEPGWRLEILGYPRLAEVGGRGNYTDSLAPAAFYTQSDVAEIVAYAGERHITVIPEIDMPGHATAANKAYPEFSGGGSPAHPDFTFNPGTEGTYSYLANILKEVDILFPAKMIHLGGDEVSVGNDRWKTDPGILQLVRDQHLEGVPAVEGYFLRRMADSLYKRDDMVLGWDEITGSGLPAQKTIIFWWRHDHPEQLQLALDKGYRVVLCPRLPLYFDFAQEAGDIVARKWKGAFNTLADVYNFPGQPIRDITAGKERQVLGMQACVWTEKIPDTARLEEMIFPRLGAMAEAAWTEPGLKDFNPFTNRLQHLSP